MQQTDVDKNQDRNDNRQTESADDVALPQRPEVGDTNSGSAHNSSRSVDSLDKGNQVRSISTSSSDQSSSDLRRSPANHKTEPTTMKSADMDSSQGSVPDQIPSPLPQFISCQNGVEGPSVIRISPSPVKSVGSSASKMSLEVTSKSLSRSSSTSSLSPTSPLQTPTGSNHSASSDDDIKKKRRRSSPTESPPGGDHSTSSEDEETKEKVQSRSVSLESDEARQLSSDVKHSCTAEKLPVGETDNDMRGFGSDSHRDVTSIPLPNSDKSAARSKSVTPPRSRPMSVKSSPSPKRQRSKSKSKSPRSVSKSPGARKRSRTPRRYRLILLALF